MIPRGVLMRCERCDAVLRRGRVGPRCDPCTRVGIGEGVALLLHQLGIEDALWVRWAACGEPHVDRNGWFPEGSSDAKSMIRTHGGFTDAEHRAKAVCARCPVREPCLKEGLSRPGQPGVWAGTTLRERRAAIAAGTTESLLEQMEVQAIKLGLRQQQELIA